MSIIRLVVSVALALVVSLIVRFEIGWALALITSMSVIGVIGFAWKQGVSLARRVWATVLAILTIWPLTTGLIVRVRN